MQNPNPDFNPIFQVSEFNELINNHLNLLGSVTIEGEITRLDIKNGRLIFGVIKDKTSSLDIFSMSHLIKNFRQFEPGMLVRITGTAGVYRGTTKFRLMVESMIPQGEGALQIAFEKLKIQLENEGLFAMERKRKLPMWPHTIGLITAKNSSAYHDMVKILGARMGGLKIILLPVSVQGREAIPSILNAFEYINHQPDMFDLVILARGGGSLEDLAAFNSEEVARAVYSSKVATISAIGHEDNWSLTDYTADLRASTPSNAAEFAVRNREDVFRDIDGMLSIIKRNTDHQLHRQKSNINQSVYRIKSSAGLLSNQVNQLIDSTAKSISKSKSSIKEIMMHLILSATKIINILNSHILLTNQQLTHLDRLVKSLDIQETLNRGFSITRDVSGKIILSSNQVSSDDAIITQLAKGTIKSHVQ